MSLKIEKNVPIPSDYKRGKGKAKIVRNLSKGDSLFFRVEKSGERAKWRMAFKRQGVKPITRKEGDGFRIWHGGNMEVTK